MRIVPYRKKQSPSKLRKTCAGKRVYRTKWNCWLTCAKYYLKKLSKTVPYRCEVCNKYHATSHFRIER